VKFKWYYIAIPLGIFLLYEMLAPKATLLKGNKSNTSTSWLAGLGSAGTGLSNLVDSLTGIGSSTSTDATGD
jgi:hypothetical protein